MKQQLTAVVMEQDPVQRDVLSALLRESGYNVHTAPTAKEGIKLARENQPDLILTELILGGMDGFEAIRQIQAFSDPYILIISASNAQLDMCLGLEMGADDYIVKPFNPRILQAKVQALGRRPRNNGPAAPVPLRTDGACTPEANRARSEVDVLRYLTGPGRVSHSRGLRPTATP
ncbi:response regulator transcription factor [Arthrobacter sp. LAPM80]|uniref:response regulator transcription factor n=1 Tax=Arthrobacter sp. LAPM80 TaxID=3141788 RepID=UPI00398AB8BC